MRTGKRHYKSHTQGPIRRSRYRLFTQACHRHRHPRGSGGPRTRGFALIAPCRQITTNCARVAPYRAAYGFAEHLELHQCSTRLRGMVGYLATTRPRQDRWALALIEACSMPVSTTRPCINFGCAIASARVCRLTHRGPARLHKGSGDGQKARPNRQARCSDFSLQYTRAVPLDATCRGRGLGKHQIPRLRPELDI